MAFVTMADLACCGAMSDVSNVQSDVAQIVGLFGQLQALMAQAQGLEAQGGDSSSVANSGSAILAQMSTLADNAHMDDAVQSGSALDTAIQNISSKSVAVGAPANSSDLASVISSLAGDVATAQSEAGNLQAAAASAPSSSSSPRSSSSSTSPSFQAQKSASTAPDPTFQFLTALTQAGAQVGGAALTRGRGGPATPGLPRPATLLPAAQSSGSSTVVMLGLGAVALGGLVWIMTRPAKAAAAPAPAPTTPTPAPAATAPAAPATAKNPKRRKKSKKSK